MMTSAVSGKTSELPDLTPRANLSATDAKVNLTVSYWYRNIARASRIGVAFSVVAVFAAAIEVSPTPFFWGAALAFVAWNLNGKCQEELRCEELAKAIKMRDLFMAQFPSVFLPVPKNMTYDDRVNYFSFIDKWDELSKNILITNSLSDKLVIKSIFKRLKLYYSQVKENKDFEDNIIVELHIRNELLELKESLDRAVEKSRAVFENRKLHKERFDQTIKLVESFKVSVQN